MGYGERENDEQKQVREAREMRAKVGLPIAGKVDLLAKEAIGQADGEELRLRVRAAQMLTELAAKLRAGHFGD